MPAQLIGHLLHLVVLGCQQRHPTSGANLVPLLAGSLRTPVVGLDGDQFGPIPEDEPVRGRPEVESGLVRLRMVLLVPEPGRAGRGQQTAGAGRGERAARDRVGVVLLVGHLVDAGLGDGLAAGGRGGCPGLRDVLHQESASGSYSVTTVIG